MKNLNDSTYEIKWFQNYKHFLRRTQKSKLSDDFFFFLLDVFLDSESDSKDFLGYMKLKTRALSRFIEVAHY